MARLAWGGPTLPSGYPDLSQVVLVLDASVTINLLGSGISSTILKAIPSRILMERRAYREIRRHPIKSRDLASELDEWRTNALVEVVALDKDGRQVFDEFMAASLGSTLDDGEAATIAYVAGMPGNAVPVVDDKKATRIFRERWPGHPITDSATLFRILAETRLLSRDTVREAVYSALRNARMRVSFEMKPWVVDLIGKDRAADCSSLGLPRAFLR